MAVMDFIKKWDGKVLDDFGSIVSPQFNSFQNAFGRELKKICEGIGASLVSYSKGHYDMSGFIERDGHYVYFHYSNYRSGRTRVDLRSDLSMYCRTAANERDYRGGSNNNVSFKDFKGMVDNLLNTEHKKAF